MPWISALFLSFSSSQERQFFVYRILFIQRVNQQIIQLDCILKVVQSGAITARDMIVFSEPDISTDSFG